MTLIWVLVKMSILYGVWMAVLNIVEDPGRAFVVFVFIVAGYVAGHAEAVLKTLDE